MSHTQQTSETSACDQKRIAQFLQSDHYRIEEADQELITHLDQCASCRESMETQAANRETWDQVQQLLPPTEFDNASTALYSASGLGGAEPRSAAIQDVLDALAPTDDPHHLGRIGTHEVTGVIGVGGMGVVLKAIDPSLDRVVAIKVMAPRLANNETARKRFAREAKAAAAVLHPNVISIHSVSSDGSVPYLVMAYIRGGSLQKRLEKEGALPLIEILRIGSQIAAGLAAAHGQGLVHRDIKPENILLDEGVERVTITDFGLARAVDDNTVTQQGTIAGTPMYMSPEQARGNQLDQQSDLFSLGSVLYALSTGQPPYRADSSYGVMRKIIDESPAPVRELNPAIPEWMALVVEKLMAKDKADRFASASEVHKLLEACLSHVQQPAMFAVPPIPGVRPDWPRTPFLKTRLGVLTMTLFTTAAMLYVAVISQPDRPSLTVYGPTPPVAAAGTGENSIAIVPSLTVEGHKSEGAEGKGKTQTHRWKLKGQSVGNMTVRLLRIENGKSQVVSESVYSGQNTGDQAIEVELQLESQDQPLPAAGATFVPTMAVTVNGLLSKSPSGEAFTLSGEATAFSATDQGELSSSHVLMHSVRLSEVTAYPPTVDSLLVASNTGASSLVMVVDWHSADDDATEGHTRKSQPPEKPVTKLSDLKDGDYFLRVTQSAKCLHVDYPSDVIPDADYGPPDGHIKTIRLQFLDKGKRVRIIDSEILFAKKVPVWDRTETPDTWSYTTDDSDNGMGKLTLTQKGDALVTSFESHGSGIPILWSVRGTLLEMNEANRAEAEANAMKTFQLEDGEYVFEVTRIAENPGVESLDSLIPHADYKPVEESTSFRLQFSNKTNSVKAIDGQSPLGIGGQGVAKKHDWDHLMVYETSGEGFERGELTVVKSGTSLDATYKVSGSGNPVLTSYNGTLVKADQEQADQHQPADAVKGSQPNE